MPSGHAQPSGREDALNRVLADFLDALGRSGRVDLPAWQARYPSFADELADLFAARREVGDVLCAGPTIPGGKPASNSSRVTEALPGGRQDIGPPCPALPPGLLGDYELL